MVKIMMAVSIMGTVKQTLLYKTQDNIGLGAQSPSISSTA